MSSKTKQERFDLMLKVSKEGHSFPHGDTCKTCEDDFERVESWARSDERAKREEEDEEGAKEVLSILADEIRKAVDDKEKEVIEQARADERAKQRGIIENLEDRLEVAIDGVFIDRKDFENFFRRKKDKDCCKKERLRVFVELEKVLVKDTGISEEGVSFWYRISVKDFKRVREKLEYEKK